MADAFYLTGIYTCAQVRDTGQYGPRDSIQVWDASLDAIVFANSPEVAQSLFESALSQQREGEGPKEITIRKVSVAPIVDRLLTESGNASLDWPKILEQAASLVETMPVDDFEQGYWVDVNTMVPSDKVSFSVGTLESNVTEEVRSGLNWSSDKQFFFLLQILPPAAPPPPPAYDAEVEDGENGPTEEPAPAEIEAMNVTLPESVALIRARNSVAAAWLWRRYAANTQWNNNAIRITPLCATIGETTELGA